VYYYTFLTGTISFSVNPLSLLHAPKCEQQWSSVSLPPKLNHMTATIIRPANKGISWSAALKATDAPLDHNTPNSFIWYTSGKNASYGPRNKIILIQINQPTRCNSFTSLLLDVYVWLNMFRAPPRPWSGAYNCIRSLWFYRWKAAVAVLLVIVWQTMNSQPWQ
jgi:hypothetical protein